MKTYYIDPDAAGGGDGSWSAPWNTWADAIREGGHIYLQKAGSTDTVALTTVPFRWIQDDNVTFGVYAPGVQGQSRAAGRANVVFSTGPAWNDQLWVMSSCSNWAFYDLDISSSEALNGSDDPVSVLRISDASGNNSGGLMDNCVFHQARYGVYCTEEFTDLTIINPTVYNTSRDGIILRGVSGLTIINPTVYDVGTAGADDCIHLSASAGQTVSDWRITGGTLTQDSAYNCILFSAGDGAASGTNFVIEKVKMIHDGAASVLDVRVPATIKLNTFSASQVTSRYINAEDYDVSIVHNVMAGRPDLGIRVRGAGNTVDLKNNSIDAGATLIDVSGAACTYSHNNLPGSVATVGSPTDQGRNIAGDPVFDANYYPHNKALIAAGAKVPGVDVGLDGIGFQPEPTIGLVEMFRRRKVLVAARGSQIVRQR